MDLPTTEPGSDLCDATDWLDEEEARPEDEGNLKTELSSTCFSSILLANSSAKTREHCKEEAAQVMDRGLRSNRKGKIGGTDLILPEIVRPCSVSLSESLSANKEGRKVNKRPPCLHFAR